MRQRLLVVPVVAVALLISGGCATKKFVREELQKSEAKAVEQVGRLDADLSQEKARVSGVASEVVEVRSFSNEASRRADQAIGMSTQAVAKAEEATGKAAQAFTKADETDSRLTRLWSNRHKRNPVETVVIAFGFDKWELGDRAQTVLQEVVKQLKENPNIVVDLEGYTDSVGPAAYNVQLSQRRAEAVRRFLVEKGVELHRIQSIGLGTALSIGDNKTIAGRAQNRRVALKLSVPE